jgi:hypothetical protein
MVRNMRWLLVAAMVVAVSGPLVAQDAAPPARKGGGQTPAALKIAALGNSLTFHGSPERLSTEWAKLRGHGQGQYERTICWGASLKQIFDKKKPDVGKPFDSYLVPGRSWDVLVIQVFQWGGDNALVAEDVDYGSRFYQLALAGNPKCQLYIYTTWKGKKDKAAPLVRQMPYYEKVADGITAKFPKAKPVLIIPTHLVWQRLGEMASAKQIPDMAGGDDLYLDDIHQGGVGAFAVDYTWYATLYKESPVGLPEKLNKPDGSNPRPLAKETAETVQKAVWDVVTHYPRSGVSAGKGEKKSQKKRAVAE